MKLKTKQTNLPKKLKEFLKNARLIIAVHNNTDENYSIKSYEKDGEFAKDIKLANIDPETRRARMARMQEAEMEARLAGEKINYSGGQ